MLITIVVFLVILSVLVLIHEAGHFFVAKLLGIKVEEFGFGFPPRALGKKFGETIYSLNWLPIGGFVKLYGEDEAGAGKISLPVSSSKYEVSSKEIQNTRYKIQDTDAHRAFYARPLWQRALVVVAGVVMNFILAVFLISILFAVVGVSVPTDKIVVDTVVKGAPADKAGLKAGDTIEYINNVKITSTVQLVTYTKSHLGEKLTLKVKDQKSNERSLELTPRKTYPSDEGPMGVAISQDSIIKKYPWYEAPFVGTKEALNETWLIASGLGSLLIQLITKGSIPQDVAGPVGIAQLTGRVVEIGPSAVLSFVSLLSLNLALINILPIPALDGGRLLFIVIEAVTRRKVNSTFEGYAHTIGMVILLALIALITIHDLIRVFTGQPIIPK